MSRKMFIVGAVAGLLALGLVSQATAAAAHTQQTSPSSGAVNPSLYSSLQWRNIGPDLGGRSSAVAGSAARPDEFYDGESAGGGLWKTTDSGQTWAPVTDGQITSSSVGAVAVCPANPDVVYIGMGEAQGLRAQVLTGDGVYKSVDDGKTWTHLGLADTQMIGRIAIDPGNCNNVYVAALGHPFGPNAERGVFHSTNGGATWQKVLFVNNQTGAINVAIDPANPKVLYAAMWQVYRNFWTLQDGGPGSGLYESTNGGASWTNLTSRLGLPAGEPIGKIGISVSPADPDRVYAMVEANGGGLFRSDDAGGTWKLVNNLTGSSAALHQRMFYFSDIWADPTDPNRVYAGDTSLLRSDDAGATFTTTIRTPHGDNHDMWINPDNDQRMVEGNDGGAGVSTNGGTTFTPENMPTGQFYHVITTNDTPYLVCGDQQDRSSECVSSTGGTGNFTTGGGEAGGIAVDPSNSNVFYATDCCGPYTGSMTRFDRGGQSFIGVRRVDPWPDNPQGYSAGAQKYRFQWSYPIVTNPAEPDAVFTGSQYVMKSTNGGQSWQQISPDLSYDDPATLGDSGGPINHDQTGAEYYGDVFTIAPSTANKNVIWAGTDDGRVWLTAQGGGTWNEVTPPGLAKFTRVTVIDAGHGPSAQAQQTAYLTGQRYMLDDFTPIAYRTHDGGRTWTKITNGIAPNDFLWSIRQDPQRPDLLYATSAHGVYVSFNDGDQWQPLSLNLPDVQVFDLTVKGNDLVISTQGRGFYVCDTCAQLLRALTPQTTPAQIAWFHQIVPTPTPITPVSPPPAVIPPTVTAPPVQNNLAVLNDPDNVVRSVSTAVTVSYTLKQNVNSAVMQFVAPDGTVIASNTLPVTAGNATTTWNMRYPDAVSFPGLIYWTGSNQGPKAPLGNYTARLVVNGQPLHQGFTILKDSRLTNVTTADIQAEFHLDLAVRNDTSNANQDVINIRACTAQVDSQVAAAGSPDVTKAGTALDSELNAVQNALYQTKMSASEDAANYGTKLNEKIADLHSVIESVDARPTVQDYQVFNGLDAQLKTQLKNLRHTVGTDVPSFNQLLMQHGLTPISCTAV